MTAPKPDGHAVSILVVEDEERVRKLIAVALTREGYQVTTADDGREALERLAEALPDLIISDVMMPRLDGLDLLQRLRNDPSTRAIPLILLTAKRSSRDIVAGLELGADDYLGKPFAMGELLARVRAKINRPPMPAELHPRDRQTGLLRESAWLEEADREIGRSARGGAGGVVAAVAIDELPAIRVRLGPRSEAELARQMSLLLEEADRPALEVAGRDAAGAFALLMPETTPATARHRLQRLAQRASTHQFVVGGERVRVTPTVGYAPFAPDADAARLLRRARLAAAAAAVHLDLEPRLFEPAMEALRPERRSRARILRDRLRPALVTTQVTATLLLSLVVPFLIYLGAWQAGYDLAGPMYLLVVVALVTTAALIWAEGFLALRRRDPPEVPDESYPPATAIVAAYLPNEAATVEETIESMLRMDYPAPLRIILAYNTPRDLPVEAALRAIAARDSRFLPLRVAGSNSKAQNVNAALAEVRGEFVAVFDADHHPDPDSFRRAWRWLASGHDVVQGHCLVRNGDESWVARLVAVEFEAIYTVAHPGRARLHGFGIFGGSNGYWRTDVLRQTRMHGFMLTEDIDASMRLTLGGHRIASDPYLISRELAPTTVRALWNQRLRWAQGWFQVAIRHTLQGLRSPHMSLRQKVAFLHLMPWRELFPWLSVQAFPILVFWAVTRGAVDLWVPIFVFTTAFTLATGPSQALFLRRLADPSIRGRRGWLLGYAIMSLLGYAEFKSLIARLAQLKELLRERDWRVTPRAQGQAAGEEAR